jgi:3-hydroxyacyl-CoA dehydrogenase
VKIRKAAVVGSGTMGAAVAAHLANAGIPVLLLDIAAQGNDKNDIVRKGLERALKAKPAAFMHPSRAQLIQIGNLEDDIAKLTGVDWVFEAILEKLDVKQDFWANVEATGTKAIVSSNSSGIPMHLQIQDRGADFKRRFVGTHFFNPPRYLKLLEVIPTPDTDPEVIKAISEFGDKVLGKGVVVAKDVPGFIANRIGVWGMMHTTRDAIELGIRPDEVDAIAGPLMGRASSATMRTNDLSGLDIGLAVAKNLDAATDFDYTPPPLLEKLVSLNRLGEKTGEGFFKRVKGADGKSVILTLDYDTLEYRDNGKVRLKETESIRQLPTPVERIKALLQLEGKYGDLVRRNVYGLIWFAAMNIPACADTVQEVDNALKWGFNWEIGAFDLADALGHQHVVNGIKALGLEVPKLLQEHLDSGEKFYADGRSPMADGVLILKDVKRDAARVVKTSSGASLVDIGDGVALLEFHSKANALGEDAMRMMQHALKTVPEHFAGLVVGNQGDNFSAGANLAVLLMQAQDGDFDEIDLSIRQFQKTVTSLRYSPFPTVSAPFGLTLGGGCEVCLYADHVQAHSELYIGLVEAGVGLILGAGGTTEMLTRFTDQLLPTENAFSAVRKAFEQIALAKTSTSALEAREDLGYLRDSDGITMNRDRLIADAKQKVLELAPNYVQPQPRVDIPALGEAAIANLKVAVHGLQLSKQASEHDGVIAHQLAKILAGGSANREMKLSTQHFLDLEREAFLYLVGTRKTQERIAHTLKTGKPLRN